MISTLTSICFGEDSTCVLHRTFVPMIGTVASLLLWPHIALSPSWIAWCCFCGEVHLGVLSHVQVACSCASESSASRATSVLWPFQPLLFASQFGRPLSGILTVTKLVPNTAVWPNNHWTILFAASACSNHPLPVGPLSSLDSLARMRPRRSFLFHCLCSCQWWHLWQQAFADR